MTFSERVGGVLVAPRATLAFAAANGRHGVRDVAILLALRLLAGETTRFAKAVLDLGALGAAVGLGEILHACLAVGPEVLGILAGAVLMGLLSGKTAARGRELDVAVYAWVPYLAVTLATALADTALQRVPGLPEEIAGFAGLFWSAVVWAIGLAELRGPRHDQVAA